MSATQRRLRPSALAVLLLACASVLTGLALARPTPMTVANALLFWAWAVTALRFSRLQQGHRVCAACGAIDPMRLPDGSCAACAAPVRRCFPELARAKPKEEPRSTSW